jgi:protein-S-isoprenylcysteine O-methyltransferase Ste14
MRVVVFIFGVVSYAVFLIAFLYAIGFVGNLYVPKTIDDGTGVFSVTSLLINCLLLGLFAIQHTIMARPGFKKSWIKIVGKGAERSFFVLFSSLLLILLYWQWRPMDEIIWNVEGTGGLVLTIIFWVGWAIVFLSTFMINHFHLFGLTQIYDNLVKREQTKLKFQQSYLYKIVRHPIMLGFIIAFWATPMMTLGHLLFAGMTTAYIFVGVHFFEEKDLVNEIGEGYTQYQNDVPMIIPFLKGKTKS